MFVQQPAMGAAAGSRVGGAAPSHGIGTGIGTLPNPANSLETARGDSPRSIGTFGTDTAPYIRDVDEPWGMREGELDGIPQLPTLGRGLYLLETDDRAHAALHSLVVDHLLIHGGEALWVDSHGHARTQSLLGLAPSRRFLERIRVARAFTAYQHRTLLDRLAGLVGADTALVVVPAVDYHYWADDLARGDPERMVEAAVERLAAVAEAHDGTVLVTREHADPLSAPIAALVDERLRVETTRFGPRFVADGFETLVYRDHEYVQTTLAFWARVLDERQQARDRLRQAVVA